MNQQAIPSGAIAADFARVRMEHIHALDLDLNLPAVRVQDVDIRLAEDHEQVALAGILQIAGHVQVRVHASLQHRNAAQLVELRGVRIIVKSARHEHVEARIPGLARGRHQVRPRHGAELRTNEDRRPPFRPALAFR